MREPRLPADVRADLSPTEEVRLTAVGRLMDTPDAREGLAGLFVLTTDRAMLIPDPGGARDRSTRAPWLSGFLELWTALAGPIMGPTRRRAGLATRSRPGLDLPLSEVRDVFVSRVPRTVGFTLTLPAPDKRPPWALYIELPDAVTARTVADTCAALRVTGNPRPDLFRPYALYYLLHPRPRPVVVLRAPDGVRRGSFRLGPDGPELGGTREERILPYEAIDRLEWAPSTALRRARLSLHAADRSYDLEPMSDRFDAPLLESARLLAEACGLPLEVTSGRVRAARLAFWLAAAAGGVGTALWEVLGL